MAKNHRQFIGLALLLVLLAGSAIFILARHLFQSESGPIDSVSDLRFGADTVRAKVLDILEEGQITLGDQTQTYQILLIKLLEGPHTGQLVEIDYGQRQIRPEGLKIHTGDIVLVTVGKEQDGTLTA